MAFYFSGQFTFSDDIDAKRYDPMAASIVSCRQAYLRVSADMIPQYPQGYDLAGKTVDQLKRAFAILIRETDRTIEFVLSLMAERGDDVDEVRALLWPVDESAPRTDDGELLDGTLRTSPTEAQVMAMRNVAATAFNSAFANIRIQPIADGRAIR